jgi:hypothetical protein
MEKQLQATLENSQLRQNWVANKVDHNVWSVSLTFRARLVGWLVFNSRAIYIM